jgi:hypothetical protein
MTGRLALILVLGALAACDAPPQEPAPAPPAAAPEPVSMLTGQQIQERTALCAERARDLFRRELPDAAAKTVEYSAHYNSKLDTCFYLLTVHIQDTVSRKLIDISENEIYGEYLGLAAGETPVGTTPDACRVESLYCSSRREWEVLVEPYMQN